MTKEALIAKGFTEQQAEEILKIHREAIDGNYVPKATFEAERTKSKNLSDQLADRDKQITELGKFKGTAEELQNKVTQLENDNKAAKEKYDADLLNAQRDAAVRLEIASIVIDPDDVIPKLDASKIVFKDGKIESGLTEQLDALKQSKPHYFKNPDNSGNSGNSGLPNGWLFGQSPEEGSEKGGAGNTGKTDAEKLGELLAASKLSGASAAEKAADVYFK